MDRTANLAVNPSPLLDSNLKLIEEIEEQCNLEVHIVFAIEDLKFAGREKDVKVIHMQKERPRVIKEIEAISPDLTICFGRTAAGCAFNRGSIVLSGLRRRSLGVPDIGGGVHVCDSFSRAVYQPGIRKWLKLDCLAAVNGQTGTKWGKYTVLQPGTPEWDVKPAILEYSGAVKVGFDLETYPGTDPWHPKARIRMGMLSLREGEAVVVQCTPDSDFPPWFKAILSDKKATKCGSFIAFDKRWCNRFGIEVNKLWDTGIAEHVLDCTDPNKGLKDLTLRYLPRLGIYDRELHELIKSRGKKDDWHNILDHEMYNYAGADGEASLVAAETQDMLLNMEGFWRPWQLADATHEVLAELYTRGMAVDRSVTEYLDGKMNIKLIQLRRAICAELGPINPGSHVQLASALADFLPNIDLRKAQWKTILGDDEDEDVSTARDVLLREADKHPIIAVVLEFRTWNKMHGSFVKAFLDKHIVHHGGRDYIHPGYKLSGPETYRLSSSSPNAQQFPRVTEEEDLNVKRQVISRYDGGVLLNADYAQMEVRVAAQLSGDEALIEALLSEDIHKTTAALMMQKKYDSITKDERQAAKTIGFATMYGAGANTIGKQLGIHKEEAKVLMGMYFQAYPKLRQYIDKVHSDIKKDVFVTTPFGFKRSFVRPHDNNWMTHAGFKVQRQAFNTIIQSTAACIMYCALIRIEKELHTRGMRSLLIGTVHDSLMVDCFPGELDEVATIVADCMANPDTDRYGLHMAVPLGVDLEVGENWGEMKKYV